MPSGLAAELQQQLQHLQRLSSELDAVWRMQSLREPAAKRDIWKRKVEQVAEEADALGVGLSRFGSRQQRRHLDEAQRRELLERRAGGGPLLDIDADLKAAGHVKRSKQVRACGAGRASRRCRRRRGRLPSCQPSGLALRSSPDGPCSHSLHLHHAIPSTAQVLEEAYETGVGIIGAMGGQRERLKATHRKVLDVLNRVGLSDSVLRLAERRQRLDKVLAYGGMAVVTLVVLGLYWWKTHKSS